MFPIVLSMQVTTRPLTYHREIGDCSELFSAIVPLACSLSSVVQDL